MVAPRMMKIAVWSRLMAKRFSFSTCVRLEGTARCRKWAGAMNLRCPRPRAGCKRGSGTGHASDERVVASPPVILPALALAPCESSTSTSDGPARIKILLTDAPSDYIEEAWVEIPRVYLIAGDQDPEQGPLRVDLFNNPEAPRTYDLLTLGDGVTADLNAEAEVPAGPYRQLRLIVSRAEFTLREGYLFNDGTRTRNPFVPSGAQTGIKVDLLEPLEAAGGTVTIVLVDFDVNENFVIQGNPETPAGIMGILFTPRLKELGRNVEDR